MNTLPDEVKENSGELISDAQETLYRHIPADCYWVEMRNLTNCPEKYVLAAMEEYAKAYAPVPGKEEVKIPSHNMFMAGGNTQSEKDFYQLGYSAAMQEKQSNESLPL